MLAEAIPRLVICLRSAFPEAGVELGALEDGTPALRVCFENQPSWGVQSIGIEIPEGKGQFQFFASTLLLKYECIQQIPEEDFLRLIASENLGLRGVSVLPAYDGKQRAIVVRAGFVGQKGRTRDESENLVIDVLSLLRFARLLEDRILRSTAAGTFSFEMYHSQYVAASRGRNRFINYARSIFQGSPGRAFGQIASMLREDHRYEVQVTGANVARIIPPGSKTDIVMRVPEEIPMVTCYAPLHVVRGPSREALHLAADLNTRVEAGHFEVSADGSTLSFVAWKHLTNDMRLYSLDHMIMAVGRAEAALKEALGAAATSHGVREHLIEAVDPRRAA